MCVGGVPPAKTWGPLLREGDSWLELALAGGVGWRKAGPPGPGTGRCSPTQTGLCPEPSGRRGMAARPVLVVFSVPTLWSGKGSEEATTVTPDPGCDLLGRESDSSTVKVLGDENLAHKYLQQRARALGYL